MITINLLPTKRKPARKITEIQKHLFLAVVILVLLGGVMAFWWVTLDGQIADKRKQESDLLARKASLEKQTNEIKNVEVIRADVMKKIGIIEDLKKQQQGPVRMLDELSRSLPPNVSLLAFAESGGNINISGEAFKNDDIVKFVDALKISPYFTDVYLIETSQAAAEGTEIYKYRMSFRYRGI